MFIFDTCHKILCHEICYRDLKTEHKGPKSIPVKCKCSSWPLVRFLIRCCEFVCKIFIPLDPKQLLIKNSFNSERTEAFFFFQNSQCFAQNVLAVFQFEDYIMADRLGLRNIKNFQIILQSRIKNSSNWRPARTRIFKC